jgi:hypothetical protein
MQSTIAEQGLSEQVTRVTACETIRRMATIGDLPATIFSPSKIAYISYVALTGLRILPAPSLRMFVSISVIFWLAEVGHNDFLRIWLNNKAEKKQLSLSQG